MKSLILTALAFVSVSSFAAPSTFSRQDALDALLSMGQNVTEMDMGEMFRDNIFILSNSEACQSIGAVMWDNSGSSCLAQMIDYGYVIGWPGDDSNSLYE